MPRKRKTKLFRSLLYVSIVLVCTGVAILFQSSLLGSWIELRTYDLRFRLRGPLSAPTGAPITVLAVDEESLTHIPDPLMLWQKYFGRVIGKMAEAGAGVVGVDFMFADIGQLDPDGQRELLESLLNANVAQVPVMLAYRIRADRIEQPIAAVTMAAGEDSFAYVNLTTDSDDFVRRQELFSVDQSKRVVSGFALAIATALQNKQSNSQRSLPTDERTILINYRGLDQFPRISFWRAVEAASKDDLDFFQKHFRDRIVLIGMVGDEDLHSTPLYYWVNRDGHRSLRTPGIEIHANTIATLLDSRFIRPLEEKTQLLLTCLLTALVALFCLRFSPAWGLGLGALVVFVYLFLALSWTFQKGWWLFVVSPVTGAIAAAGAAQVSNFVLEGREKRRLRRLFKRYVNDQVIERILHTPEHLALEGEKKRIAVLFADIRNFSTRSEGMPPEVLVAQLNQYLTAMVEAIQKHQGMVDKFIGDGIMAVFGAPLPDGQAAAHALAAATEMLASLNKLNAELTARGQEPIGIGIGIHTGEAVVGNVGSPEKMEYTAIGDVVNTASRIESLTRKFDADILLSGETAQALTPGMSLDYLGEEIVKGKKQAVSVYRFPIGKDAL